MQPEELHFKGLVHQITEKNGLIEIYIFVCKMLRLNA